MSKVKLETFNFFSYTWSCKDEENSNGKQCVIYAYGWNKYYETIRIKIDDFKVPLYVELPEYIEWTEERFISIKNRLNNMSSIRPIDISFQKKIRSHYAYVEENVEENVTEESPSVIPSTTSTTSTPHYKYKSKTFPYLLVTFKSLDDCSNFSKLLYKDIFITGLGKLKLRLHSNEKTITPVLKLLGIQQLSSAGWAIVTNGLRLSKRDKETTRKIEYICSYNNMNPLPEEECLKMPIIQPKVLMMDDEVYSSDPTKLPHPHNPDDKVFQIGISIIDPPRPIITNSSIMTKKAYRKILLSLGEPDQKIVGENVKIQTYTSEQDLFLALTETIREEDPEIIGGYNILGFDIPHKIERADRLYQILPEFSRMGCTDLPAPKDKVKMKMVGNQFTEYEYLDAEGRLFLDLLPYIRNNYKIQNYRLKTVCEVLLKDTNKDPMTVKKIFKSYRQFTPESLGIVGKYCVQDAHVCSLLYEKLLVWYDLVETATTNNVPMFYIYTQGQQIKIYSQIYRYAHHNNIIVESNAYETKDDEHCTGAYVSDPKKGIYRNIFPFDFSSLYPSIMMSHNIDYSKLIKDFNDMSIPFEDCHVFNWTEHIGCAHDPSKKKVKDKDGKLKFVCANYKYRFLKQDVSGKGIVPTLLENLIGARKRTRRQIASNEVEIKIIENVLNKKQLRADDIKDLVNRVVDKKNECEAVELLKDIIASCADNIESLDSKQVSFLRGIILSIDGGGDDSFVLDISAIKLLTDKVLNLTNPAITDNDRLLRSILETLFTDTSAIEFDDDQVVLLKNRVEYLESINQVLDRRQNAYKINANSMYGAMGVKKGYLPFLPGAMCVTYVGRSSILKANKYIENEQKGIVIYNDTDSAYCHFPHLEGSTPTQFWDFCEALSKDAEKLFPPPMKLEFEQKRYETFLILTKKRYVAKVVDRNGKVYDELLKRGIVLQRRDNCLCLREVYQQAIWDLFEHVDVVRKLKVENVDYSDDDEEDEDGNKKSTTRKVVDKKNIKRLDDIMKNKRKNKNKDDVSLVVSKTPSSLTTPPVSYKNLFQNESVKFILNRIIFFIDSLFQWKYSYKDFVITKQVGRTEYKSKRVPAHVFLSNKLIERGMTGGLGTRMEYIFLDNGRGWNKKELQQDKIEDLHYFSEFREILRLDYLYYMEKQLIKPLDELLLVSLGIKGYIKNHFKDRVNKANCVNKIKDLFSPKFIFE